MHKFWEWTLVIALFVGFGGASLGGMADMFYFYPERRRQLEDFQQIEKAKFRETYQCFKNVKLYHVRGGILLAECGELKLIMYPERLRSFTILEPGRQLEILEGT